MFLRFHEWSWYSVSFKSAAELPSAVHKPSIADTMLVFTNFSSKSVISILKFLLNQKKYSKLNNKQIWTCICKNHPTNYSVQVKILFLSKYQLRYGNDNSKQYIIVIIYVKKYQLYTAAHMYSSGGFEYFVKSGFE